MSSADQTKVYDKAHSLRELRYRGHAHERVYERVARLRATLASSDPDYRSLILRRACDDVLGSGEPDPEARFVLQEHVLEEIQRLPDEQLGRYLFYRYRYDVFPRTRQLDDFPPCLQIEPTSICNYRCVFCYQTDKQFTLPRNGQMGMMSFDLFRRVVDEAEGRCEAVTLASRGEPLMAPDFDRMLEYIGGKFLALKLNTNAWFLDERKAHAILQAGVNTLVFSADAASEPLYSQLRVNGKLQRVVTNIERFQEIRARDYAESTLITRVSGVRFSSEQNLDEMDQLWGRLVDQVAFVDYNPWENTYERPLSGVTEGCSDLWRRMFVWFDGTVNPCDVDYRSTLAVGTAMGQSLADLWTGELYSKYREAHGTGRRGDLSPCNRCTVV